MVTMDALELSSLYEEKPQEIVVSGRILAELPVRVDGCVRVVMREAVSDP